MLTIHTYIHKYIVVFSMKKKYIFQRVAQIIAFKHLHPMISCFNLLNLNYMWSLVAQRVKNMPAVQKTQVQFLEEGTPTHSSILAWRIPWTEESGGLQSMGLPRVRHDWGTFTFSLLLTYLNMFFPLNTIFSYLLLSISWCQNDVVYRTKGLRTYTKSPLIIIYTCVYLLCWFYVQHQLCDQSTTLLCQTTLPLTLNLAWGKLQNKETKQNKQTKTKHYVFIVIYFFRISLCNL